MALTALTMNSGALGRRASDAAATFATGVVVTKRATASMFPVCTGALLVPSDTLTSWSSISVLDW